MKIHQLFTKIDDQLLQVILNCFTIDLSGKNYFTEFDFHRNNVITRLENIKHILKDYYIPCKYRIYVDKEHNVKSAVSILRQILRLYNYKVIRYLKSNTDNTLVSYRIVNDNDNNNLHINTSNIVFKF